MYHRGCRGKRKNIPRLTSNTCDSLIEVKAMVNHSIKPSQKSCQMVVINIQSIKSKEHIIMECLMDKQVDIAILMETWLCKEDETWVAASECNKNGYKLDTVNRNNRRGGGIGLIYQETIKVVKCKSKKTQTFEHTICSIKANDTTSTVLVVYHPPYSDKAPITNAMFLDEVTDFLATFLVEHNNIIITGDFNIHVNDTNDPEAQIFLDTMVALGMDNHVNFATHNRGNTLDLVLTEALLSWSVVTCRQGPFLSDHCSIELEVAIPKPALKRQTITSCNIKDVVIEDLVKELDLGTIEGENINDLVNQLENKCKTALDTLAPETTKCVTIQQKKCWLAKEVLDQKKMVRRREKIWQKYKTDSTWRALTENRNKYNAMLWEEKMKSTSDKVEECEGDTKKLYSLVRYLRGTKAQNPMPTNTGNEKLANDFADYFIQKIPDNLDDYPPKVQT